MNRPIPNWLPTQDYLEARNEFIRRRTLEMKEIVQAQTTINDLMSNSQLRDEVEAALAKCLYRSHESLMTTLDSCIQELARIEFEENDE